MKNGLPQSIVSAAVAFPEREAFRYDNTSLTYSELDHKSSQLANHLICNGVKKGARVGVYLFRSLETPIAIYGIMKAGAAFVPIDPGLPVSRIAYLLTGCDIEHLVTQPTLRKKHPKILLEQTPLKSLIGSDSDEINSISWDDLFETSLENYIGVNIEEEDLAYVMYTSGSTGFPKGIMHTHRSGLSYAKLSVDLFRIEHNDRLASHAPLHFDISTLGYLAGPLAGSTTVILSEAHTKMAASLADLLEKEKITIWYSVPLALVQLWQNGSVQSKELSHLRLIMFGGEIFANKYLSQWMQMCPKTKFYNIYGPAEVNQCTAFELKQLPKENDIVPIGKVWGETEYLILDLNGESVTDTEGELAIHSSTMMKGYWNNASLTKKSLHIEQTSGSEKVFFKTGDIVIENKDGELVFLGRNDRQVKIRGYRIEIDEIEAALLQHENIVEAAVVVLQKSKSEKEILAAVITNSKEIVADKEVKAHCRRLLPNYAVPQAIEFMHDFPRTGSGKIDRNRIMSTYTNA